MLGLLCIVLACVPLLLGAGVVTLIDRKNDDKTVNLGEFYLCGFICCIGIFEVVHLAGVFLNKSLSFCMMLLLMLVAAGCLLSVVSFCFLKRKMLKYKYSKYPIVLIGLFVLLMAGQIVYICVAPVLRTPGDIVLETVQSFLATDGIYEVSPLTGQAFSGTPLRYEILNLPTMYALLAKGFGVSPELVVNRVIPVVVLCACYMAYCLLSGSLFGKDKSCFEKRSLFMIIAAMLFFLNEHAVSFDGYGVLHAGYLGTTIRNCVLVPLLLHAALERKWWLEVLCILAEVCIAWTFWGLGVCVAVAVGMAVVRFLIKVLKIHSKLEKMFPALGGEEEAAE